MKPVQLIFGGLGPYRDKVEIDFSELDALGLYLIVGETGAGKSTIFDAMTYALYGDLANGRPTKLLVSDHPGRVQPFVDFTFDLESRRFRVRRTLDDGRQKSKPGDQRIEELSAGGLAPVTKSKEVTDKVKELIGLDADQFFKVVMIPQNQFREFLVASDKEKMTLLQTLFGTHLYDRIATRMTERARDQESNLALAKVALEGHRRDARGAQDELPDLSEFDGLPDVDDNLNEVVDFVQKIRVALQEKWKQLDQARRAAITAAANAKKESERFDAAKELADEIKSATRFGKDLEKAQADIDLHGRAVSVEGPSTRFTAASKVATTNANSLKVETERLGKILAKPVTRVPALATASNDYSIDDVSSLRRNVSNARSEIERAIELYEEIDSLEKTISEATREEKAATSELASAEKILKQLNCKLKILTADSKLVNTKAKSFAVLDRRVVELDDLLDKADIESCVKLMQSAEKAFNRSTINRDRASEGHDGAMARRTRHLAGDLASELAPGESCPVCGSTEHPAPARPMSGTDANVEKALELLRSAEREREVTRVALDQAQGAVKIAKEMRDSLPNPKKQSELRAAHLEASAAVDRQEELSALIEDLREEQTECKESIAESRRRRTDATKTLTESKKNLTKSRERATSIAIFKDIDRALGWCDEVETAIDNLAKARSDWDRADSSLNTAKSSLDDALQRNAFASAEEARKHNLDIQRLEAAKETVAAAAHRSKRITKLQGKIGDEPVPSRRPNVEALEQMHELAETAANNANDDLAAVKSSERRLKAAQKEISRLGKGIDELKRIVEQCIAVAKIFTTGEVSSDRLSLERWVQRSMFAEVCEVATVRLRELTHDRYRLTLEADGASHARRTRGLALFVTDSFTGQNRPVETLSGGEQFLTSLALALALGDVVQHHAGGIDLGALFIDEGFGSLDGNTLDTAVEVLRTLQGMGRVIGVISHVDSMQSELPIGLVVQKDVSGSRILIGSDVA
jgi:exonuclease SbcC